MKKFLMVLAILVFLPSGALATLVTIPDTNTDRWGPEQFNVHSITVENNPNVNMYFNIASSYPKDGYLAEGAWMTYPADLLVDVAMNGSWDYAIPLYTHKYNGNQDYDNGTEFVAGKVYRINSMWTSTDFKPSGTWSYNAGEQVWLKSGTDTGLSGTWSWRDVPGDAPDYNIIYNAAFTWSQLAAWIGEKPDERLLIRWATATCANDTIEGTVQPRPGQVPEPATMLLLGFGLMGLAGFGRKKIFNK